MKTPASPDCMGRRWVGVSAQIRLRYTAAWPVGLNLPLGPCGSSSSSAALACAAARLAKIKKMNRIPKNKWRIVRPVSFAATLHSAYLLLLCLEPNLPGRVANGIFIFSDETAPDRRPLRFHLIR